MKEGRGLRDATKHPEFYILELVMMYLSLSLVFGRKTCVIVELKFDFLTTSMQIKNSFRKLRTV